MSTPTLMPTKTLMGVITNHIYDYSKGNTNHNCKFSDLYYILRKNLYLTFINNIMLKFMLYTLIKKQIHL